MENFEGFPLSQMPEVSQMPADYLLIYNGPTMSVTHGTNDSTTADIVDDGRNAPKTIDDLDVLNDDGSISKEMDDIRGRLGKLESDCKIKFAELNEKLKILQNNTEQNKKKTEEYFKEVDSRCRRVQAFLQMQNEQGKRKGPGDGESDGDVSKRRRVSLRLDD